jgi:carbonic anhydrase/acetyltransferase-like protein (isoleucine patch superfamily)
VLPFSLSKRRGEASRVSIMIRPFRGIHPQIHPTAFIEESAQVVGDVHVGEHSSVWFGAVVRGDVFHISNGTHATILEDEVTVGHNVTLHGCYVERGCLVGIGAIVMDACRVGHHSLVAAGALLSPGTVVPPRSLVMGVPARVKRQLTDAEVADLDVFWQNYVGYTRAYREEYGIEG